MPGQNKKEEGAIKRAKGFLQTEKTTAVELYFEVPESIFEEFSTHIGRAVQLIRDHKNGRPMPVKSPK
jgi:hypothetical protein